MICWPPLIISPPYNLGTESTIWGRRVQFIGLILLLGILIFLKYAKAQFLRCEKGCSGTPRKAASPGRNYIVPPWRVWKWQNRFDSMIMWRICSKWMIINMRTMWFCIHSKRNKKRDQTKQFIISHRFFGFTCTYFINYYVLIELFGFEQKHRLLRVDESRKNLQMEHCKSLPLDNQTSETPNSLKSDLFEIIETYSRVPNKRDDSKMLWSKLNGMGGINVVEFTLNSNELSEWIFLP